MAFSLGQRSAALSYTDDTEKARTNTDNNVHPSNMMQLIEALQQAGKSFEVQVGPDRGHSGINTERMMEFFIENLVLRNPGTATAF